MKSYYSQGTLNLTELLLEQAVQSVKKNPFQKYSEKNSKEDKRSSTKSK